LFVFTNGVAAIPDDTCDGWSVKI